MIATPRYGLLSSLRAYAPADEREASIRARMLAFVEAHPDALERSQSLGHVTASAWVLDRAHASVLLTHHRKLGKWLQLGGHLEGDRDVSAAALREAREESGLPSLRFLREGIFDLDVHVIPARPGEAAHEHFDVRFVLEADEREPLAVSDESQALAWVALRDIAGLEVDESVLRLVRKSALLDG